MSEIKTSENPKMYIIMNSTLKMDKGKLCSQAAHGAGEIIRQQNHQKDKTYMRWWKTGTAKIVKKATQEEIEYIIKHYSDLFQAVIYDAGKTQVAPNSLTCIASIPTYNQPEYIAK